MSTATLHRRLRRQMPWLTPTYAGDTEIPVLRRPSLHDIDRIAALGATDALPTTEADIPLLSRPVAMPPPIRRPQVIDVEGRPSNIVFGTDDPEQQILARRRALEVYQPQKESKKSLALRTVLGFLGGGLAGRGGVAETLLGQGGILDRRAQDRAWQQGQLAQTDEQLGRLRTDRRAGLQDRLLESQVMENEAEAAAKLRAPAVKDIEVGGRLLRPNAQGGYDEVFAPPVKPPSAQRPLLRSVTAPDGSTRTLKSTDNGETWQQVPELQGAPKPEPPDTAPFTNENLQRNISEAEVEKRKVAAAIANTAEFLDQFSEKPNPIHQQLKARERELDDKIRAWRADMKAPRPPAINRSNDTAIEQRLRDEAKRKNLDPEKAVQRYREGKRAGRF